MRRFGEPCDPPRTRAARCVRVVLGLAGLLLVSATRASAVTQPANPFAMPPVRLLAAGDPMPEGELVDQAGKAVSLADFRGKTLVVGFVYTSCKDECPLITRKFGTLESMLPAEKFHLVEVSIDPAHDSPRVLAAYGRRYGVNVSRRTLLTGTPDAVTHFGRQLGLSAIDDGRGTIVHNDRTIIVDANGRIADIIDEAGWTPSDIVADANSAAGLTANPLDRLDLALGRAVAYVCGGVVNGRAGVTDLVAVLAIFGLSTWAMVWVSRKFFTSTS